MKILKIQLEEQFLIKYFVIKAFYIAKNLKYEGYQRALASMVFNSFDKKNSATRANEYDSSDIKNENMSDRRLSDLATRQLAEELHKPIIRNFKNRKVHSPFINNIWGADFADMQLTSRFNKGTRFLLCVIDISSKYTRLFL